MDCYGKFFSGWQAANLELLGSLLNLGAGMSQKGPFLNQPTANALRGQEDHLNASWG